MRIQNNLAASNAYRQLNVNVSSKRESSEKLASGLRINKAGDDAASLSISEKMRSQIRGLDRSTDNVQDGINMIQAAEGALQETHAILQRMRELAVQGANDVNSQEDRSFIRDEINQLGFELDKIAFTTNFNGKYILSGQYQELGAWHNIPEEMIESNHLYEPNGALCIQAGANPLFGEVVSIHFPGMSAADLLNGNLSSGSTCPRGPTCDCGDEIDVLWGTPQGFLPDADPDDYDPAIVDEKGIPNQRGFHLLMEAMDSLCAEPSDRSRLGIPRVNALRAELGATQNRLEHTLANNSTVAENIQGAESKLRDADMAKEQAASIKDDVLIQSATGVLAQANQQPELVLQLFQ